MPKRNMLGDVYIMASIEGRPYDVGFQFRVIGTSASVSENITIYEISYDSSFSNPTVFKSYTITELTRGRWEEFDAGRGRSTFTVVVVYCKSLSCMVTTPHTDARYDIHI